MPDLTDDSALTSLFPDEVLTRALVRDVQLPSGAGTTGAAARRRQRRKVTA
jgi:hypothetical protein